MLNISPGMDGDGNRGGKAGPKHFLLPGYSKILLTVLYHLFLFLSTPRLQTSNMPPYWSLGDFNERKTKGCHLSLLNSLLAPSYSSWASLVPQLIKTMPSTQETWVWSLGQEDLLGTGMAIHSNILARRIPWTRGLWQATVYRIAKNQTQLSY